MWFYCLEFFSLDTSQIDSIMAFLKPWYPAYVRIAMERLLFSVRACAF